MAFDYSLFGSPDFSCLKSKYECNLYDGRAMIFTLQDTYFDGNKFGWNTVHVTGPLTTTEFAEITVKKPDGSTLIYQKREPRVFKVTDLKSVTMVDFIAWLEEVIAYCSSKNAHCYFCSNWSDFVSGATNSQRGVFALAYAKLMGVLRSKCQGLTGYISEFDLVVGEKIVLNPSGKDLVLLKYNTIELLCKGEALGIRQSPVAMSTYYSIEQEKEVIANTANKFEIVEDLYKLSKVQGDYIVMSISGLRWVRKSNGEVCMWATQLSFGSKNREMLSKLKAELNCICKPITESKNWGYSLSVLDEFINLRLPVNVLTKYRIFLYVPIPDLATYSIAHEILEKVLPNSAAAWLNDKNGNVGALNLLTKLSGDIAQELMQYYSKIATAFISSGAASGAVLSPLVSVDYAHWAIKRKVEYLTFPTKAVYKGVKSDVGVINMLKSVDRNAYFSLLTYLAKEDLEDEMGAILKVRGIELGECSGVIDVKPMQIELKIGMYHMLYLVEKEVAHASNFTNIGKRYAIYPATLEKAALILQELLPILTHKGIVRYRIFCDFSELTFRTSSILKGVKEKDLLTVCSATLTKGVSLWCEMNKYMLSDIKAPIVDCGDKVVNKALEIPTQNIVTTLYRYNSSYSVFSVETTKMLGIMGVPIDKPLFTCLATITYDGKVTAYRLVDINGNEAVLKKEVVRESLKSKRVHICNLAVASNGHIVETYKTVPNYEIHPRF